jgi:hypothetical protein
MPTRFLGVEVAAQYAMHQGDLTYFEDIIPCCTFTDGTGIPFRISVIAEQWVAAKTSLQAGLGVTFQSAAFTSPEQQAPMEDGRVIRTEYELQTNITSLAVQAGVRQRLFSSFLSVGADLRGLITIGSSQSLVERVLGPDDYYFTTNPPSKEWQPSSAVVISDISAFVLEPSLVLQYDLALARGSVLSPSINVSMPLTSLASGQSWGYVAVGFGVRLSRGF